MKKGEEGGGDIGERGQRGEGGKGRREIRRGRCVKKRRRYTMHQEISEEMRAGQIPGSTKEPGDA